MKRQLKNRLLILLSAFAATTCIAEPSTNSVVFLPGVAANPSQTTLFTAGVDGRLIAINLADGSVRWRSNRQLEALGFSDGTVIASATVDDCLYCLKLVWLSAADGREQRTSATITFPDWVRLAPAVGKQFTATVETSAASLALLWKASSRYVGGARPSSRILADFKKDAAGTFVVDLQGQARAVETPSKAMAVVPAALHHIKTSTYWNCSEWIDLPVVDHDGMVVFDRSARSDGQTLSARRWRLPSGQIDANRQLMQGSNLELQISPDARYLFIHDGAARSDAQNNSDWELFSLRTLRRIAIVPYRAGQACANVAADAVVMLIEKSPPPNRGGIRSRDLVAYATSSGELRWSVKLRGDPQQAHPR